MTDWWRCVKCPEPAVKRMRLASGNVAVLCADCFEYYASRRPCVYFFRSGDRVKIGYSATVLTRLRTCQTGSPYPIELWHVIDGCRDLERELHERFADARVHGEWFDLTDEIRQFVEGPS